MEKPESNNVNSRGERKVILKAGIVLVVVSLVFFGVKILLDTKESPKNVPTSYEECAVLPGSVILEIYPEQCRTKNGEAFTRVLTDEERDRLNKGIGS